MTKRTLYIVLFVFLSTSSLAQLPAEQENMVGFRSEWFGGLNLHTNGWGVNLTRGKFKTYKKYNLYSFDFVHIKHPKEYKIRYQVAPGNFARAFKYGKLNSFYNARFSYGQQRMVFEKLRDKGVEVYFNWKTGVSLGLLKPIYLEIINIQDGISVISEEKYNPDNHNESNIYGKGAFGSGFSDMKIAPGGHIKGGFKFELAKKRENIFAIETGLILDIFPTKIPILAYSKEEVLFYNFYINILFGKKYYD
ncbi:MAG: hypothetical protein ACPGVD_06595 [Flavobacteriales bacterium]